MYTTNGARYGALLTTATYQRKSKEFKEEQRCGFYKEETRRTKLQTALNAT